MKILKQSYLHSVWIFEHSFYCLFILQGWCCFCEAITWKFSLNLIVVRQNTNKIFDWLWWRSHLVPETENQGVCISLAYCSSSDDIVASFRPKVEFSNEIAFSQTVLTPPMIGQGIQGSRVLLKKVGNCYQKLGSSSTIVNDIRLPKSTIIHLENQKRLFASGEEVTHELILQELPSFSVVQRLKSQNHPIRDVKYIRAHNPGLLCCLSEDALQLYSTLLT